MRTAPKPSRKPTAEQLAVVRSTAKLLIVRAFAGTGKTTTLEAYAEARPNARIIYIAYTAAMAEAARAKFKRFPNVTCITIHALASRQIGWRYRDASKLCNNLKVSDLVMSMKLDRKLAKETLETLNNFVYSADKVISEKHVEGNLAPARRAMVLKETSTLWEAMKWLPGDPGEYPYMKMTHDGYLKLFGLFGPNLTSKYDHVLLDEAQDSNPVTADIVLRQPCTRVLVGDPYQSIFGFRKAANAMEFAARLPGAEVAHLTRSFRFGSDTAAMATALLSGFRGERMPLLGNAARPKLRTRVDRRKPYTIVSRTNAAIFMMAVDNLGKNSVGYVGGVSSYPFDRFVEIQLLAEGRMEEVQDPFFRMMGSLSRLQEYAEDIKDVEILGLLKVQKEYGSSIPDLVERIRAEAEDDLSKAQITMTTGHRCKGLEWPQVVLVSNFEDFVDEEGERVELNSQELVEELHLLYVAMTRAEEAMEINDSLRDALALLGCDPDFKLPPGTQDSEILDRLMRSQHLVARSLGLPEEDPLKGSFADAAVPAATTETSALLAGVADSVRKTTPSEVATDDEIEARWQAMSPRERADTEVKVRRFVQEFVETKARHNEVSAAKQPVSPADAPTIPAQAAVGRVMDPARPWRRARV
jgi:F-box protein, helicase, 18